MRNRPVKNKLGSRRGATMALALLLLMIASMVTAVVLTSAVTTAKRMKARKDTQQALLTLQSAVTMVRDQYTESTAEIVETRVQGGVPTYSVKFIAGPLKTAATGTQHPLSAASLEALRTAYTTDCSDADNPPKPIAVGSFGVSAVVGEETLENSNVAISMLGNKHGKEESYMDYQIELICSIDGREEQLDIKLDTDVYSSKTTRRDGTTIITTQVNWRPEGEA